MSEDSMHMAEFSSNREYRYTLFARLDEYGYSTCNFIMLNPSTADEVQSDPTVTRCKNYAKAWGFSICVVTNIFALRTTYPKVLKQHPEPVGKDNDYHIYDEALNADLVVVAWGAHGSHKNRDREVMKILGGVPVEPVCLGTTKANQPRHPLYLPKDVERVKYVSS